MRFHNPLTHIIDNQAKVICLRLLGKSPAAISGRQLSKIVSINPTTVNKALNSLIENQIILVRKAGKSHLYELNKTNWLVINILVPMFNRESMLLNDFMKYISQRIKQSPIRKGIMSVVLYGSVHERNEEPTSDIDLFIVVKEAKYKKKAEDFIFGIDSDLMPRIGMGIEPYIKTKEGFKKDRELNVIKSILKSNRLIWGQNLEEVL